MNIKTLELGSPMPEFTLPNVDGAPLDTRKIQGRPILVTWWCNHCPYVRANEERVLAMAKQYGSQVQFLFVNSNDAVRYPEDSFDDMKRRAKALNYPAPYLYDESQEIARTYGAICTPHAFLFDTNRRLAYQGGVDDNYQDIQAVKQHWLRDALEAVVQGKSPAHAATPPRGCSVKWKI